MCQEMLPGRCREERHSPVGWLVLIVKVIGFGRDWWGIPPRWLRDFHRGVTEREKPLSWWTATAHGRKPDKSKRGACARGWASRGPDRLRPCFNHHKLCHAFLAIMDWSHLDCETKQSFPLMSYSYGVFCVIYTKMTNTPCQQYTLKFGLSPRMPLTSWGTFELHRTSVSPSVKIVIVILAL